MIGSPPIPTHVDWPMPGVGHRLDRLVGQRPGARHDADPALAVDRARDDPDLGPAGRGGAGAVRPDEPGAGGRTTSTDRDHVERRDALGDAEDRGDARRRPPPGRRPARRPPGRRCTTCWRRSRGRPRRRCRRPGPRPSSAVWPPLPGVTPATMLVPYSSIARAWNSPSRPVMPWTTRRVSRPTRMLMPPLAFARRDGLGRRLVEGGRRLELGLLEQRRPPPSAFVPDDPDDHRHVALLLRRGPRSGRGRPRRRG